MYIERPLLATEVDDVERLEFSKGFLATPKIDGIRCIVEAGKDNTRVKSRTFKLIPNAYVRTRLSVFMPDDVDLDGELTMLNGSFQDTTSRIMSEKGNGFLFVYHVFDMLWSPESQRIPYVMRSQELIHKLGRLLENPLPFKLSVLKPHMLTSYGQYKKYEKMVLKAGFEGVMLRRPSGVYKFGRSTENEEILIKCKRFRDSEAEVIGMEQAYKNTNVSVLNELGYKKKSAAKAGRKAVLMMGALVVKDLGTGIVFNIGTGFTIRQRQELWYRRESVVGRIVKYKYQSVGVKVAPRVPSFLGFRED